jgi:tetratricopeptide (TPR) repeat protein
MALVNVAVELAKSGQRVLIVDFDLEAPGLDTFNLPRPQKAPKGIVDFVHEYLDSGESPDVTQFVYRSAIPNLDGELWVMPAGSPGNEYDRRFKLIDWRDLYETRDGYLLFEDLKEQWDQQLQPDYVLIDSRTGHTDVSGICTRQLPDSVVLFFFPNEQNRRGLETIVQQIKGESATERKRDIKLHFVMSNVPELDDEEGYLAGNVSKIQESLGFEEPSAVVHHYPSPALLVQTVFTLERPRTKLAQEYEMLTKVIRRDNLEDREVALEFLEEVSTRTRARRFLAGRLEPRLLQIEKKHGEDTEVLTRLALLYRRMRRFDEALTLLEHAGDLKAKGAEFYLARAELYIIKQNLDAALGDVKELLRAPDATYIEVSAAARILQQRFPNSLTELLESPAFIRLDADGKYYVANELQENRQGLSVSAEIIRRLLDKQELLPELNLIIPNHLGLAYIGLGRYEDAINVILSDGTRSVEDLGLADSFNFAVAQWGMSGKPSPKLFKRVIELGKESSDESANGHQCLALAFWILNDIDKAGARLNESWQRIVTQPRPEFSCWSYLMRGRDEFVTDLDEMKRLFNGEDIEPRFIRETKPSHDGATQ